MCKSAAALNSGINRATFLLHRCPESARDPVVEQFDRDDLEEPRYNWLAEPGVQRSMREVNNQ